MQAEVLKACALLTLPRLLDAAALYAPSSSLPLVRALFQHALALLPDLAPAWEGALPDLAANLGGVRGSLAGLASQVRLSGGSDLGGIAAGVALLRDGAATLAAAAAASPCPLASALLAAGGGCIPGALAALHDDLLPDLAASLRGAVAGGGDNSEHALEVRPKMRTRMERGGEGGGGHFSAPDPS